MWTRTILLVFCALGPSATAAAAQDGALQPRTANTLTASAEVPSPPATIQQMAWFAGRWTGTGLGGATEEIWSEPSAGAMMGVFRLVKEGKPVFYELLTFAEHEGSLVLRLKHFNPDLTGWEEKGDVLSFRLLRATPQAVYFDGMTFRRDGPDRATVFLAIQNRAKGTVREEAFPMTRER